MAKRSEDLRRGYAAAIMRSAGVTDARVKAAFEAVPREDYAGPPPWRVSGGLFGHSDESDLAGLYEDVLVTVDAGRGINNGQPSLHALSIDALKLKAGERVVQIGAGAGYYTAILAELVGPFGKVFAYEIERDIAERARANLAKYPQVEVHAQSGAGALPKADAIYVNCAATHPVETWLDALKPGGRLLFPMHAAGSSGAMLLIERPEEASDRWPARFLSSVVFIACEGAQDGKIGRRLNEAFRRGGANRVRSLHFGEAPGASDWLHGDGWSLSSEAAE